MLQRLQIVAPHREIRCRQHVIYLAAQQRNIRDAAAIGGGREKTKKAPLPAYLAVGVMNFHTHRIHRHIAVYLGALGRFGND